MKNKEYKTKEGTVIDTQTIKRLVGIVDKGLVYGLGAPIPGKVCVEAAVCLALGLPHGDHPNCVLKVVRNVKISLNDFLPGWESNASRASGLRRLAVAQIGSEVLDERKFARLLYFKFGQTVFPFVLRKASSKFLPEHKGKLLGLAKSLEGCKSLKKMTGKCLKTSCVNFAFGDLEYRILIELQRFETGAWTLLKQDVSGHSIVRRCDALIDEILWTLNDASHDFKVKFTDEQILCLTADVVLDVLKEMGSPGCQWLYLCQTPKKKRK